MTGNGAAPPDGGQRSLGGGWECAGLRAGSVAGPGELAAAAADWLPALVPGTVAGAYRAAGRTVGHDELDGRDWWFRHRFPGVPGAWLLELGGVATVADVWLNGVHLLHGENMFRAHRLPVDLAPGENELVIRCAALAPLLAGRAAAAAVEDLSGGPPEPALDPHQSPRSNPRVGGGAAGRRSVASRPPGRDGRRRAQRGEAPDHL